MLVLNDVLKKQKKEIEKKNKDILFSSFKSIFILAIRSQKHPFNVLANSYGNFKQKWTIIFRFPLV